MKISHPRRKPDHLQPHPVGGGSVVGFWCLEKSCRKRGGWKPGKVHDSWFLFPSCFKETLFSHVTCSSFRFLLVAYHIITMLRFLSTCIPGISGGPIPKLFRYLRMFNDVRQTVFIQKPFKSILPEKNNCFFGNSCQPCSENHQRRLMSGDLAEWRDLIFVWDEIRLGTVILDITRCFFPRRCLMPDVPAYACILTNMVVVSKVSNMFFFHPWP